MCKHCQNIIIQTGNRVRSGEVFSNPRVTGTAGCFYPFHYVWELLCKINTTEQLAYQVAQVFQGHAGLQQVATSTPMVR